jgi:hypothetical protein
VSHNAAASLSLHRRAHDAVTHAKTALYISAHKKRCRRREREGNGLAAVLRARVRWAEPPVLLGSRGAASGGMDMGPSMKKQGTNETSAWLAKEGKGQGEGSCNGRPPSYCEGLGPTQAAASSDWGSRDKQASSGPEKQPANQGRTTRQAPRFPARERERELIAFPVPAAPRAFPPSPSPPPPHTHDQCVGGSWVCVETTGSGRRYNRSARGRGGRGG